MTWNFRDRVEDTTTTPGASTTVTLNATPPTGRVAFGTAYSAGARIPYVMENTSGSEWETGRGTLISATSFERTEVLSSSNSGNIVTFSAGSVRVYVDAIAAFLSDVDTHGQVLARSTGQALP